MLSALAIGITLIHPGLDFDSRAAALGTVLEKLTAASGAKLRAAPRIAREIVLIRSRGKDLNEIKARLADALEATWIREGNEEILTRTNPQDKQVWDEHVAYRRKLVDLALGDSRKRLERPFDGRALATGLAALPSAAELQGDNAALRRRYEQERELFSRGPMARLLDRVLLACDPKDLAGVGPFERRVFSLQPTPMQRGFNRKAYDAALAAFAFEQQTWIEEAAKVTFNDSRDGREVSDPRAQVDYGTKIAPLFLEVRRSEIASLFLANLCTENRPPFGFAVVSQSIVPDPGRRFLDSQMQTPPPSGDDPIVPLGDDAKEFQDHIERIFTSQKVAPMSGRLKQMVLGVERNDPLAWAVSDALLAYAEKRNLNVVAALPDSAITFALYVSRDRPLRVEQFVRSLVDSGNATVAEKAGWVTIAPPDRYEAWLDFTPRDAVVRLMKDVFASGKLDIRSYARYAFESGRLNRGGLGEWFLAMFDRSVLGASDRTDWKSLQFYGSLSPTEERELESGKQFTYGAMTPAQRTIVERIVYSKRLEGALRDDSGRVTGNAYDAVEPTVDFALGVPASCVVSASTLSTPVIVAYSRGADGKPRPARPVDVYTLATLEVELQGDPARLAQYGVPNPCGYAMGTHKMLSLRVEVRPGVSSTGVITLPDYPAEAEPTAWDKLPDPYPKQIAVAIEQAKARKAAEPRKVIPPQLPLLLWR